MSSSSEAPPQPPASLFHYYYRALSLPLRMRTLCLPQPLTGFPPAYMFFTALLQVLLVSRPFALQHLYTSISGQDVWQPVAVLVAVLTGVYWTELKSEAELGKHKLRVRAVLSNRVIRTALLAPYELLKGTPNKQSSHASSWSKISANVNIFVNNYYTSYMTMVTETIKAIFIMLYLLNKLGVVVLVGLGLAILIAWFTLMLSRFIQQAQFRKNKIVDSKTRLLTQYFTRIADYQMSWLDKFVGDRIRDYEAQYQGLLRKIKMLDSWCVGFWQFTQFCISSLVLCLYYYNYEPKQGEQPFQPVTVIYFFQMLTFPINCISWNIAGLRSAERALHQLSQGERNQHELLKREKKAQSGSLDLKIHNICHNIVPGKIYALADEDPLVFRKLAMSLKINGESVSYAEENGFMLPTFLQSLCLLPEQQLDYSQIKKSIEGISATLCMCRCEQLPLGNPVSTYSGGQKMRLSLARALLHSKFVLIDSDLTSLDARTREQVLRNIRQRVTEGTDIRIILKSTRGDETMAKFVDQFFTIDASLSRVLVDRNETIGEQVEQGEDNEEKIKNKDKLSKKLHSLVDKLTKTPIKPKAHEQPIPSAAPVQLSLSTLKFYFQSIPLHLLFVLSLGAMYAVGNYFNYFINMCQPGPDLWKDILIITLIYVLFIVFRSAIFAIANLKQGARISNLTNNLMVYNKVSFYTDNDKYQAISSRRSEQEHTEDKPALTEKLVYLCTAQEQTINDRFPFSTNILWNNIATVLGSLVMIVLEVPVMLVIALGCVYFIKRVEAWYRRSSEACGLRLKEQDVRLMKVVNNIEAGALYLHVFGNRDKFTGVFERDLQATLDSGNQLLQLEQWVKSNLRGIMTLFLLASIVFFLLLPASYSRSQAKPVELGLMVRNVIMITNYLFYLTMSVAKCRLQAFSIERIRCYAQSQQVINGSFERMKKTKEKIKKLIQTLKQGSKLDKSKEFVNLKNFNYRYNKKGPTILDGISLKIQPGDRILLKGKTGAGKTTLFKILMGLYPEVHSTNQYSHLISFSAQHPLPLGSSSILQKIDPYSIMPLVPEPVKARVMAHVRPLVEKHNQNKTLSHEQQVLINNIRTYLYSHCGLGIYDQPQKILDEVGTYLVVTHHGQFSNDREYVLEKGRLRRVGEKGKY